MSTFVVAPHVGCWILYPYCACLYCTYSEIFAAEDSVLRHFCSLFVDCNLLVILLAIVIRLSFCNCDFLAFWLAIVSCIVFCVGNTIVLHFAMVARLAFNDRTFIRLSSCSCHSVVLYLAVVVCFLLQDCISLG